MTFLSKMPINANVDRKDWGIKKNKNFLIFLMDGILNGQRVFNPLWLAFKPKFESHKKLSRKTHTLQRL